MGKHRLYPLGMKPVTGATQYKAPALHHSLPLLHYRMLYCCRPDLPRGPVCWRCSQDTPALCNRFCAHQIPHLVTVCMTPVHHLYTRTCPCLSAPKCARAWTGQLLSTCVSEKQARGQLTACCLCIWYARKHATAVSAGASCTSTHRKFHSCERCQCRGWWWTDTSVSTDMSDTDTSGGLCCEFRPGMPAHKLCWLYFCCEFYGLRPMVGASASGGLRVRRTTASQLCEH